MKSPFVKLSVVSCQLSVVLLALIFSLFTFVSPAFAQDAETTPQECKSSEAGDQPAKEAVDEINRCAIKSSIFDDKIFNFNQIAGTTDSLLVLLTGFSQLHPETNDLTEDTGAVAAMGGMVASLYSTPPASGVTYLASKFQQFNPVQPAYAQEEEGVGFGLLKPVEKVWTAFRNISYAGFIIVFVVIGFMIMFRRKISAQAVATIQDSLPRIVIALVLVTFSYAIAGLMIDIMFVALNILISILQEQDLINQAKANEAIFEKNVFELGFWLWDDVFRKVFFTVQEIIKGMVDMKVLNKVLGFIGGGLAGIIAGVAVIFVMFKLFIMLLFSYVSILLLTIFAPFLFLFQALPGNNGAKEWFKQMGANLSVFFTVALMFLLAGILSGIDELGGVGAAQITSENITRFPLLASGWNPDDIGKLIAIGLVLMTPSAAKIVKDRFGVKDGAIGAGAGAALGALGAGAAPFQKAGSYAAAPYKQAMSHERTQRAYKLLTDKEMYGPTTASKPGDTGEGK